MSTYGFVLNHILTDTDTSISKVSHTISPIGLPTHFDLRKQYPNCAPQILDQGVLGTCTACAIANSLRFFINRNVNTKVPSVPVWQPSRLFIYYYGRLSEGNTVIRDTGMSTIYGLQSISQYGACFEERFWPYVIGNYRTQPPTNAITNALKHRSISYSYVPSDLISIKQTLCSGFPVIIGLQVYANMYTSENMTSGDIPMPGSGERMIGGHCFMLMGFDDVSQRFIVMNSWGTQYGKKGWFSIPYQYVLDPNLCRGFYCITNYS